MEGVYAHFPDTYHCAALFLHKASRRKFQKSLIGLFYEMNMGEESFDVQSITSHGIKIAFDIGIADELTFNFIDDEERSKWLSILDKREFEILDFLLVARYYISRDGRDRPLRFDYYMLRFLFGGRSVELRIYHEKGTRRLSIEDLVDLLYKGLSRRIGEELSVRLEPLGTF